MSYIRSIYVLYSGDKVLNILEYTTFTTIEVPYKVIKLFFLALSYFKIKVKTGERGMSR